MRIPNFATDNKVLLSFACFKVILSLFLVSFSGLNFDMARNSSFPP